MSLTTASLIVALVAFAVFLSKKWIYSYWQRKGVPEVSYGEAKKRGYKHMGYYALGTPVYTPLELDTVKEILIKKFDHFVNRGSYFNEKVDPLSAGLFNLEDEKWRHMRMKLSPTFTSGKMKMMFHTMVDSINVLMQILENHSDKNVPIEALEMMSRYTMDVIGSCAFGVECNAINDPTNSEFQKYGKDFTEMSWRKRFRVYVNRQLLTLVNFSEHPSDVIDFFVNLTKNMVEYRDSKKVTRKDFLQLLIQLRDQGEVSEGESLQKTTTQKGKAKHMTIEEMAAHCYTFFGAGFATSSSTLSFSLLEIAQNQEIQNKLREEIKTTVQKEGKLTYEGIMSMEYLDKVVNETLRKYPVARGLLRVCNKPFKVPGTDFTLEPGVKVNIQLLPIHKDPEYYPEPEKFDPERFSQENKAKRHPMAYMPFGDGPRLCIGFRFALLQMKVGLATILDRYKLTLNEKTQLPVKIDPRKALMAVDGGCWINIHSL